MKTRLLFLNLISLLSLSSEAQQESIFPYEVSAFIESYIELEDPVELTSANVAWDDPDYEIPLGYDFEFLGSSGNSLFISPLYLGGALGFYDDFTNPQDLMIIYGSDIIDIGFSLDTNISKISYLTEGEPGSRITKIQWKDCGFYNEYDQLGTANNRVNFQCWIYEGTNDFEVRFGSNSVKQPELVHDEGGLWMGFLDNLNIFNNSINNSWFVGGEVLNPTTQYVSDLDNIVTVPLFEFDPYSGLVYRFSSTAITSVAEERDLQKWSCYPNPAQEQINFYSSDFNNSNIQLDILDMNGRLVNSSVLLDRTNPINVSDWSTGIYFARIIDQEKVQTLKFIVE